jgi:NAD(P)-dependent dehydrogenase (short-subunit alcohol dehydrogenase family)
VVATARETDSIADLAERGAMTRELDVTKPAQCRSVVEETVAETGRLDCLVNNAGIPQYGPIEDVPTRLVEAQYDVNVFGPLRLVRVALPALRDVGGSVVTVSSVLTRLSPPGMGVYASSKAAIDSLHVALRSEVAPFDVDVAVVEPGAVETGFTERARNSVSALDRSPDYEGQYAAIEDWNRVADLIAVPPERVAAVILEAGVSTSPRTRYPVGTGAQLYGLLDSVPDRVRDAAFALLGRLAG